MSKIPPLRPISAAQSRLTPSPPPLSFPPSGAHSGSHSGAHTAPLVLLVGPSGSGKDSLLKAAKSHFGQNDLIAFPRRFITRANDKTDQNGEQHIALTAQRFEQKAKARDFFLSWSAHGLMYAIGQDAQRALRQGQMVVANISRTQIQTAAQSWPHIHLISIKVGRDILRQRLTARGRETPEDIETRIKRADAFSVPLDVPHTEISNNGALQDAQGAFISVLEKLLTQLSPD